MKRKFKVNNRIVDAETLVEAVEKYKEMAPKNMTIEALRKDEEAAIDAYKVAIENLQGVASNKAIEVLEGIMKDEMDHLEKLNAILYGREENVEVDTHEEITEDSCKDSDNYIIYKEGSQILGTNEDNYNRRIQNEREIQNFTKSGFNTVEEVKEYMKKYGHVPGQIIIK